LKLRLIAVDLLEVAENVSQAFVRFGRRDGQGRADGFLPLQSQADDDGVEQLLVPIRLGGEWLGQQIAEGVGVNECQRREIIAAGQVAGLGNALEFGKKFKIDLNFHFLAGKFKFGFLP
jgi:hypothetical protein